MDHIRPSRRSDSPSGRPALDLGRPRGACTWSSQDRWWLTTDPRLVWAGDAQDLAGIAGMETTTRPAAATAHPANPPRDPAPAHTGQYVTLTIE
jgi:hypothetical protein